MPAVSSSSRRGNVSLAVSLEAQDPTLNRACPRRKDDRNRADHGAPRTLGPPAGGATSASARSATRRCSSCSKTSSAATGASPPSTPPAARLPRPAPARTLPGGAGGGAGRRRHAAGDRAYGAGRFRRAGPRGGVRPHRSRLDRTGRRSARVPRRRTARGAALSTALHWLSPAELAGFYAQAGELLAPGGVLLNADHMRYDRRWPGLAELSRKHRERVLQASVASGADSWEDWWQRAAQIPGWPAEGAARRPFRAAPAQARQRRRTARSISISPPCARRASPRPPRSGSSWTTTSSSPASPRPDTPSPGRGNTSNGTRAIRRTLTQINAGSASLARIHNILLFSKSKHIMLWRS